MNTAPGKLRVLFMHPHFPGQFAKLARHMLLDDGFEPRAIAAADAAAKGGPQLPQLPTVRVPAAPDELDPDDVATRVEQEFRAGAAALDAALEMKRSGWVPDVIYLHAGWGYGVFIREAFPDALIATCFEWYYSNRGADADFLDPDRPLRARIRTRTLNASALLEFADTDLAFTPTNWQRSRFPEPLRRSMAVVPDGIDTGWFRPDESATFDLPDGRVVGRRDRLVTYATRGADPYRGFDVFMRAAAEVQARDPECRVLVAGDGRVHYGPGAGTRTYGDAIRQGSRLDPARTHFLDTLSYKRFRKLLQVSRAHVYLSVPFVLSWSALEAMATGCVVVGSDNMPLTEFVAHGESGLLCTFHDAPALADAILRALDVGPEIEAIRERARAVILERGSAEAAVSRHLLLLRQAMAARAALDV